jgi:hypothetical protein
VSTPFRIVSPVVVLMVLLLWSIRCVRAAGCSPSAGSRAHDACKTAVAR